MTKKWGSVVLSWTRTCLHEPGLGKIPLSIDPVTFMPLLTFFDNANEVVNNMINKCVTDELNPLLLKQSKMLLKYHYKLGHIGFGCLEWILRNFKVLGSKGNFASEGEVPKCSSCLVGGMERRAIQGKPKTDMPTRRGCLKREQLSPGQRIFTDQYICSTQGKIFSAKGQLSSSICFKGGSILCDAASGYMAIYHQQGLTANETLQNVVSFERDAEELNINITGYQTGNGVFTSQSLITKLHENSETLRLSGVGAHLQNGVAENVITNISRKARVSMLHTALRWPERFDKSLWSLAMSHTVYLHNHMPRMHNGLSPVEIWTQSKGSHTQIAHAHPWGCPTYVLNATLQDGFKIPRFEPRAMLGVYVEPSPIHVSNIGLILNPNTCKISPQVQVIYDDFFETIPFSQVETPKN